MQDRTQRIVSLEEGSESNELDPERPIQNFTNKLSRDASASNTTMMDMLNRTPRTQFLLDEDTSKRIERLTSLFASQSASVTVS